MFRRVQGRCVFCIEMAMNTIIHKVHGNEVTFQRNGYYRVNWWLESENIAYEQSDIVVDPHTFQPVPCAIRFQNEKDLLWFLLRWL